MAIREGILVLLAEQPKYGYQLKREFELATGEAWTLNVGQVYTTLGRLERDGLVLAEQGTDDQQLYRLTATGSAELRRWLATALDQRTARDVLSIKILLAVASSAVDPVEVISVQRAATMAALQDLQHMRSDGDDGDLAWLLHLDRLVYQAEAELRWLDRVEDRIDSYSPQKRAAAATPSAMAHKEAVYE